MNDFSRIREDFPILSQKIYGKPLVYFDNGATTHKPLAVTHAMEAVHNEYNSNIHRAVHFLSDRASSEYENARAVVKEFINAGFSEEIIFTSGTTASINMLAWSFGEKFIGRDDEIVVTELEHHANIVPWQMLCERKGAKLRVAPVTDNGELDLEAFISLLSDRTKIVSMAHVSNALGTILPVKRVVDEAHKRGIPVHLDGAQGIQHGKTDVRDIGCDFYSFSGHKVYGPTGIGVLYGRKGILSEMPPWMGGGDMVEKVSFAGTTYNVLPFRFEAGTMNFTGAIGLAAALKYVQSVGIDAIAKREAELLVKITNTLGDIPGVRIIGTAANKIPTLSFVLDGIHQFDAGMILDKMGIAVRTGIHCAQPIMDRYGIDGTIRASLAFYNTPEEIDQFKVGVEKIVEMFN